MLENRKKEEKGGNFLFTELNINWTQEQNSKQIHETVRNHRELKEREKVSQHIPHYVLLMDFKTKEEETESALLDGKSKVRSGRRSSESNKSWRERKKNKKHTERRIK